MAKPTRPRRKRPALPETQQQYADRKLGRLYRDLFTKTGDPIALLECFNISLKRGIYPPVSILRALNRAFQKVLDGNGAVMLDHALGLKRKGQGTRTAFTEKESKGQQLWLAVNIDSLIEDKGLTIAQAAEQVSLLTESLPNMKRYSAETLAHEYSGKWKKQFQQELALVRNFDKPLP